MLKLKDRCFESVGLSTVVLVAALVFQERQEEINMYVCMQYIYSVYVPVFTYIRTYSAVPVC